MHNTFVLLFILLFFVLSLRNFLLAISFVVFALPAYLIRFEFGGIPYTMLEVMIGTLFVTHLFRMWQQYRWIDLKQWVSRPSKEFLDIRVAMGVLFISASVAVFVSPVTAQALGIWKAYFLEAMLFFIMMVNSIHDRKNMERVFYALGLSVLVVFIFGIYQKLTGWKMNPIYMIDGGVDRITSIYGFPNAIGLYVGPIVVFYVGWGIEKFSSLKSRVSKIFIFQSIVIVAGLFSLLLAKSDGALVGVFAGIFFLGVCYKPLRTLTIITTLAMVAFFVIYPPAKALIIPKIAFTGWSEQVRLTIWRETLPLVKDHFLFGVGLSGYPIEFVKYHRALYIEIFQYPHNILLNFLVEMGLIGLLAFLYLCFSYLRLAWKLVQKGSFFGIALIAVMIEIFVHGLVDVPYFKNDLSVLFWIFIATAVIANKIQLSLTSSMTIR